MEKIATNLLGLMVVDTETKIKHHSEWVQSPTAFEIVAVYVENEIPHLIVLGADNIFWWGPISRFKLTGAKRSLKV
jgi:hypothetical protein